LKEGHAKDSRQKQIGEARSSERIVQTSITQQDTEKIRQSP